MSEIKIDEERQRAELQSLRSELGLEDKVTKVEEVVEESVESEVTESPREVEKITDSVLDDAIKQGYDPNYKGPNKKSPEQFLKDGSFFRKIDAQNKKIDELVEFNRQTLAHAKKVEQAAIATRLADLTSKEKQAVQEGDVEAYEFIRAKALAVEKELAEVVKANTVDKEVTDLPAVKAFKEKHSSWVNGTSKEDKLMQACVNGKIAELLTIDPNYDPAEGLAEVEATLKERFPKRFENDNQKTASIVGTSTVASGSKTSDRDKLTAQQKSYIARAKQYDKTFKTDDYIKQLKLTGDL